MRAISTAVAVASALFIACGGGGSGDAGPGPGGPTWHATSLGAGWKIWEAGGQVNGAHLEALIAGADGKPLVAFSDPSAPYRPHLLRWDGSAWGELGTSPAAGVLPGAVAASLTSAGEPVLVWSETNAGGEEELRAARFTGAWTPMGGLVNGTAGNVYEVRAAATSQGPVVAWKALGPSLEDLVRVARWDGAGWVEVGTPRTVAAWSSLSLAVTPAGAPVIGTVTPAQVPTVEVWDAGTTSWVARPALPVGAGYVEHVAVAVDGGGALYATVTTLDGLFLRVGAVQRSAPGAGSWTSLGTPPGLGSVSSPMELQGLPGGGIAAAWTAATTALVRWTGSWETVGTRTQTYEEVRPMVGVATADDLYFGSVRIGADATMTVTRYARY